VNELEEILLQMARGYTVQEIATKDGDQTIKTKHIAPCVTALKILESRKPKQQDKFALMTREELIEATKKLLEDLQNGN